MGTHQRVRLLAAALSPEAPAGERQRLHSQATAIGCWVRMQVVGRVSVGITQILSQPPGEVAAANENWGRIYALDYRHTSADCCGACSYRVCRSTFAGGEVGRWVFPRNWCHECTLL